MLKNILIVEDEALIADHLALLLGQLSFTVAGIVDDAEGLMGALDATKVDVILMDVNLGGTIDGIDLAHTVNARYQIPIIYITSNSDNKTLERIKLTKPAGFVTKPFTSEQLKSVLALVNPDAIQNPSAVQEDAFFIKEKHTFLKLNYADVLYVEANDNYSNIYTQDGRHVLSQTLKTIESKLKNYGFIRSHRSYLVNIKKIEKVAPKAVFINNKEIPMSENCRTSILEHINLF